ncbi:choice-of-anchor G family protein [Arthrobacter sp. NPDC056727]|uniref:choice-of-anchor G family protein n=1 Tax=Arthrobacter sp. NPDC056727 TaxID=3345927 RepID=UPI00366B630C
MRAILKGATRGVVDRPRRSLLVAAVAAISVAAASTITSAAWTDDEWVSSAVGVASPGDCATNTLFTSQSRARQLTGTVLNTSLDSITGVEGLTVTNNGIKASPVPVTATPVPGTTDAFISKLPVTALGGTIVEAGLGLGAPVGGIGSYTQWAQSKNSGQAKGASGLVSDQSGAMDVAGTASGAATAPKAASISLGAIVPTSLAGVTLDVGAVASSAVVDSCAMINGWPTPDPTPAVERDYGIASLDLNAEVPAIGSLSTQGGALVGAVPDQLNALTGTGGLATAISNGISDIVKPLLGTLGMSTPVTTVTVSAPDLSPVRALMTGTLTDPDGTVTMDLGTGTVMVDLASLTGGTTGLNGKGPNHAVVLDAAMTAKVNGRVTALLDAWKNRVLAALTTALRGVTVDATTNVTLTLAGVNAATVAVKTGPSTLGQFLDGTAAPPVVTAKVLGLDVGGVVGALLGPITTALTSGANSVMKDALNATVFNAGLIPALGTNLQALITPAVNAVGSVLAGVGTLVAIHVNVQPDQPWPGTRPADVTAAAGQYKVSAVRVGLIDNAGLLSLSLGNSSAGPVALRVP